MRFFGTPPRSHSSAHASARTSLRVFSRNATLAPVVSAAATGRFALLHRVFAVSASTTSGRLPAGASPHVACVTSQSHRRDRSVRSGALVRAETHARRAGVALAASRAAFGAFATGASADSGAPTAGSADATDPPTTMTVATTRVVVWFRNDLRLADNYVIKRAEALAAADSGVEILPVYCFDPRSFERSAWGSPKTGAHRARFQRECVADLQKNLRLIGSDLLVAVGKPEEIIAPLVLGDGKTTVVLTQVRLIEQAQRSPETAAVRARRGCGRFCRRPRPLRSSRRASPMRIPSDSRSSGRIRRRAESKLYSLCYLRHARGIEMTRDRPRCRARRPTRGTRPRARLTRVPPLPSRRAPKTQNVSRNRRRPRARSTRWTALSPRLCAPHLPARAPRRPA